MEDSKKENLLEAGADSRGRSRFLSRILPGRRGGGRRHQNVRIVNETSKSLLPDGAKEKDEGGQVLVVDAGALLAEDRQGAAATPGEHGT